MERSRDGEVSPWLIDALLATFVTLAIALIIATAGGGEHRPDVVTYLFAAGFGGLMLLRRRLPRVVLAVTVLGLFAYYTVGYPSIGVAIPVVAALYSAAEVGLPRASIIAGIVLLAVSWAFRILGGEPLPYLLGYELVSNIALVAAAIALGDGVHTRRARRREQDQINRLIAEQLKRDADRRVQRERESIGRDLHDLIGHTMSVIALQANVAAEAIGHSDVAASVAVDHIRDAGERTMRELRATVRILRGTPADFASLANVDSLIATARASGLDIDARVDAAPAELSQAIDSAAYRIIQEALTNVIRHAHATRATVRARPGDGRLRIEVSDNGHGPGDQPAPGGHGLAGMAERARLLGGDLRTRATEGGGFTVEATLPLRLGA